MAELPGKDLLGLEGLDAAALTMLLDTAASLRELLARPIPRVPTLRGRTVALLFFEPSTRTRHSFEVACKVLGADSLSTAVATSSVTKGESLVDTAVTLERMGVSAIVLRHPASGAAALVAGHTRVPVVNAGDGAHEHPTQGLLDLLTIRERVGRFAGLRVTIVGDVLHSRVARSDSWGLAALGARVTLCGPATLLPEDWPVPGVRITTSLEEALSGADVVIALRLQLERRAGDLFPSVREYAAFWGIASQTLAGVGREVVVLHPGPVNRGVELSGAVTDGPASAVREQVTHGVAVRMAVLYHLLGGAPQWVA